MAPRVNVLGVGISAINRPAAVDQVRKWIQRGERHYVNLCVVHTVMECQSSPKLREIVNSSGLSVPDGMPLVWLAKWYGHSETGRVYGPDLMLALCEAGLAAGWRHYFFGGGPGVAQQLAANLAGRFSGLQVAGAYSPPFRPVDAQEAAEVLGAIDDSRADIVWVGLGTPKQDYWVARHRSLLNAAVLVAVGAAFDFHTGRIKQAPLWMQRSGLEWLFRLSQEPRRLAYRYLVYNPLFVGATALQLLGLKRYDLPSRPDELH